MMAPAKETSCEGHLPIVPATPVWVVAKLLQHLTLSTQLDSEEREDFGNIHLDTGDDNESGSESEESGEDEDCSDNENGENDARGGDNSQHSDAFRDTIADLAQEALATTLSPRPMTSVTEMQHNMAHTIPPTTWLSETLNIVSQSINQSVLLKALQDSGACEKAMRFCLMQLQAVNILNKTYCSRLHGQLAHKEAKVEDPGGKGKLVGDGMPCLLPGDDFYELVVVAEASQIWEEREKVERQNDRESRVGVLAEWKKKDDKRKEGVAKRRADWEIEKVEWEAEKATAKAATPPIKFTKKKLTLGKLPLAIPRPKPGETNGNVTINDNEDWSESHS